MQLSSFLQLYSGVGKGGYIQPSVLAEFDVIVTTYETLIADFHHVKTEEGKIGHPSCISIRPSLVSCLGGLSRRRTSIPLGYLYISTVYQHNAL